jgi:hypothetical protein|tara:strand:+ start:82 stop:303 length:222 start_codon:yes stop_codon:yes gene_type:complete
MKSIILILTFLSLSFNSLINAEEVKCKFYDLKCKGGKFVADTKDYQKKKWNDVEPPFKKSAVKIKNKISNKKK